jgi:hypothetical protein
MSDIEYESPNEGFLTTDDFKGLPGAEEIDQSDIDGLNNRPVIDGSNTTLEIRDNTRTSFIKKTSFDDDKPTHFLPNGTPVYRADNTGEMYHTKRKTEKVKPSLLESTPKNERITLERQTFVLQNENGDYHAGFTTKEAIVKKHRDNKGKWLPKKNLYQYEAVTEVPYNYQISKLGIDYREVNSFEPGDIFRAHKSSEIVNKRKHKK